VVGGLLSIRAFHLFFKLQIWFKFEFSQIKFESTQEIPNKIQMKIQLITLARSRLRIIDGAKSNLGISGKKQEVTLMCCIKSSFRNFPFCKQTKSKDVT
jgi:hypothetical protein